MVQHFPPGTAYSPYRVPPPISSTSSSRRNVSLNVSNNYEHRASGHPCDSESQRSQRISPSTTVEDNQTPLIFLRPKDLEPSPVGGIPSPPGDKKPRNKRPPKTKKEVAIWSHEDIMRFLDYLWEYQAEIGEGFSFKKKTYTGASEELELYRVAGGEKNADACSRKWNSLKAIYGVIGKIKDHTGWGPWSDEQGAGITALEADSWDRFVAQHKTAKPFRNAGWPYLEKVERIMPYIPKGTNVFRPRRGRPPRQQFDSEGEAELVETWEESLPWDEDRMDQEMQEDSVGPSQSEDNAGTADSDTLAPNPSGSATPPPPIPATPSVKKPVSQVSTKPSSRVPETPGGVSSHSSAESVFGSSSSKRAPTRGTDVLHGLLGEVSGMNQVFRNYLAPSTVPNSNSSVQDTPARRRIAVSLVQKEKGLDKEDALDFLFILTRDKAIMDTYSSLTDEDFRVQFVHKVLQNGQRI
ncbi:hypothetical protein D9757_009488 [Collybiopsis confluens]|uniref:Myb-like domain-containing protein n=1 Tax=Collybiopsis confluens TaxID=2823264 RepID=A0A8H5M151_9AGAR|nr:hypothetical protein D9757_009488 [Collybiopsis confluens]